jgi:hypothetical protein
MPGKQHYLLTAGVLNLLLFALFIGLAHPIYNTNEDVFVLYQLSGGFGSPPTELLHYNYGMAPFLSLLLKKLFLLSGKVNWYTMVMLLTHYIACTHITFQLLKYSTKALAILSWLALFIVFECQLLLNINFTNTSIILGLSGLVLLVTYRSGDSLFKLLCAALFIVAGALFRIHTLIPLAGIALPFLVFPYQRHRLLAVAGTLALTAGVILLMNWQQQSYYKAHIDHWQQEETHRQNIFAIYNNKTLHQPAENEKWYTEFNLIKNGLPIDTSFLSDKVLQQMMADLKSSNTTDAPDTTDGKNWFFINNRVFFCAVLLLLFAARPQRSHWLMLATSGLLLVAGLTFLHFYYKLPNHLLIASLFGLCLLIVLSSRQQATDKYHWITCVLFVPIVWGGIRAYKINKVNMVEIASFREAWREIAASPQSLFIITADDFPLQKFGAFDLPQQFPLSNFLNNEHFMNNTYLPTLLRFGSKEMRTVPYNDRIFFRGLRLQGLDNYFTLTSGKKAFSIPGEASFTSGKVYRIIFEHVPN